MNLLCRFLAKFHRINPLVFLKFSVEYDKIYLSCEKSLHRTQVFTFLYLQNVSPDNNASERAIRNIKVKQKVSGQFKSTSGAFGFADLRSDTLIKNNLPVLNSLKIITNLQTD